MRELVEHELHEVMPHAGDAVARFISALNDTCVRFDISTMHRQAAFIAQIAEESGELRHLDEQLHYKDPKRVQALFRRHLIGLSLDDVKGYMSEPALFASRIYANRNGNGDEASGDGYRYRGGGLPQLTFKDNYRMCGNALGIDLVESPDLVRTVPKIAALAAGWFWKSRGMNALADRGEIDTISTKWNGGANGLHERAEYFGACVERFA